MQTHERYFCSQITNVWKRNWAHHSFSIQTGPQWVLTILNNGCMELRSSPPVSTKCHARQNVQKGEVAVLKDMALCDTLGRQIHPEFCVTGPLLSAAFSPGIKLQIWAMGADRRWASRRHWREWIRECGRWQGRHAVYLTEWRGAFFFSPGWAALWLKHRWEETSPLLARHVKLHTTRAIQLNFPL